MNDTQANDSETQRFSIPEERMGDFAARIAKLVKISSKLGCKAPSYTEVGEEFVLYIWDNGWLSTLPKQGQSIADAAAEQEARGRETKIRRFAVVEVTGERPKLAGWRFLAKLEHTEEGTMIQKLDEAPVPEIYRNAPPSCDHCEMERKRRDTYVVTDGAGQYKQVGRTCLKDFSGHTSPEHVAQMCQFVEQLSALGSFDDDNLGDASPRSSYYSLDKILAFSAKFMREGGFVSRASSSNSNPSTASLVVNALLDMKERKKVEQPSELDYRMAADVKAWGESIVALESEDYLWNLSVIARVGIVQFKRIGLAASMVKAYQRSLEIEVKRETERKAGIDSEHFGKLKEHVTLTAKVLKEHSFDGTYGTTYIYKFLTEDGNVAVWFSSNPLPLIDREDGQYQIGIGDTIALTATVKAHEIDKYDGTTKQTVITRGRKIEAISLKVDRMKKAADETSVAA